jgi:hypothetical protein
MYMKEDYASALPLLRECIEKEPNSPEYRYHIGMVLAPSGCWRKGESKGSIGVRPALAFGWRGTQIKLSRCLPAIDFSYMSTSSHTPAVKEFL